MDNIFMHVGKSFYSHENSIHIILHCINNVYAWYVVI